MNNLKPFTMLDEQEICKQYFNSSYSEYGGNSINVLSQSNLENSPPINLDEVEIIAFNHTLKEERFGKNNELKITVVAHSDATKLVEMHKNCVVYADQLILFVEEDSGTNIAGRKLLWKAGSEVHKLEPILQTVDYGKLLNHSIEIPSDFADRLLHPTLMESITGIIGTALKVVPTNTKFVGGVFSDLGDLLSKDFQNWVTEHVKIGEDGWNDKHKSFNPVFIPDFVIKLLDGLDPNAKDKDYLPIINKLIDPIFRKIKNEKTSILEELSKAHKYLTDDTYGKITGVVDFLFDKIEGFKLVLYESAHELVSIAKSSLNVLNALLCGIYNSLIDVVAGLIMLVGWICKGISLSSDVVDNFWYYIQVFTEMVENLVDFVLETEWVPVLKSTFFTMIEGCKNLYQAFKAKADDLDIELSVVEFFYYLGYFIGMVVETVISILFTGGTVTFAAIFDDLLAPLFLLAKGFKTAGKATVSMLSKVLKFFRAALDLLSNPKRLASEIKLIIDRIIAKLTRAKRITKVQYVRISNVAKRWHKHNIILIEQKVKGALSQQVFLDNVESFINFNLDFYNTGNDILRSLLLLPPDHTKKLTFAFDRSTNNAFLAYSDDFLDSINKPRRNNLDFSDTNSKGNAKRGETSSSKSKSEANEVQQEFEGVADDLNKNNKNLLDDVNKIKFTFKGFITHFDDHQKFIEVKVIINDPKVDKHLKEGGDFIRDSNGSKIVNPEYFKEEYSYFAGKESAKYTKSELLDEKLQGRFKLSGFHMAELPEGIQIIEIVETKYLVTGEKVVKAKIGAYLDEADKVILKDSFSTIWPENWDIHKIKNVIEEACQNVLEKKGRRYLGETKEGIPIEWYVNNEGKIETAYISLSRL